jgi:hypothetical protein
VHVLQDATPYLPMRISAGGSSADPSPPPMPAAIMHLMVMIGSCLAATGSFAAEGSLGAAAAVWERGSGDGSMAVVGSLTAAAAAARQRSGGGGSLVATGSLAAAAAAGQQCNRGGGSGSAAVVEAAWR